MMYAILGATGKVGRKTIGLLLARGAAVRAVAHDASRAGDLAALGCDVVACDLRDVVAISDYGAELPSGTGVTRAFHHLEQVLGGLASAVTFVRSAEHMQNWARFVPAAARTGI